MSEAEHHPSPRAVFSLRQLLVAGLACALLGVGLGTAWSRRSSGPSDVDLGFLRDMIDHHDQAVAMALITIRKDDIDGDVRRFATEVLIFQRWEIGLMDARLEEWGETRGSLERRAMEWMGMSSAVGAMPGMQAPEELELLDGARGAAADELFLTMMAEHHLGGVHMASFAESHGNDERVVSLAARMAANQRVEVNEYKALLERLAPPG